MTKFTALLIGALMLLGACTSSQSDATSDSLPTEAIEATSDGESTPIEGQTETEESDTQTSPTVEAVDPDALGVSVNGTELSVEEFNDHIESWARLAEDSGQKVRDDDGVLFPDFVGSITEQYLRFQALMDSIAAEGTEITAEHRSKAETTALASLGEPNNEPARALAVEWLAGIAALEPSEEELDAYVAANTAELSVDLICSSHILVETAKEANTALERLAAGEVFAELAMEISTDPGSGSTGGDLGCVGLGAFVPEFEAAALAAELGVVTEPVKSDFGFHLIVTREPSFEDLRPVAAALLEQETAALLDTSIESATIKLAPQFGEWDPTSNTYTPPVS